MAKIYLVRHGEAAAKWDQAVDPGLSDKGWTQSEAASTELAAFGPLPLISSPLKRCRETAQPSEKRLSATATVIPAVAEIPSPEGAVADRRPWLQNIMTGTWAGADAWLKPWRQGVLDALADLSEDTIVFSHFVAINVAVGAATGDDRVIGFRPDNCSITILSNDGGSLSLIQRGREADTLVR